MLKHTAVLLIALINVNASADTPHRIGKPQSTLPATVPEAANLAEAAGTYIASVEQLNVLKTTRCGYALKRQIPNYEQVVANEILPVFPPQSRNEVATAFNEMKKDVIRQGQALFEQLYTYYTQTERLDNNTACGFITGAFISTRKLTAEAFVRAAAKRP